MLLYVDWHLHHREAKPLSVIPRQELPTNGNHIRELIDRLEVLGDLLESELGDAPPSYKISRAVMQVSSDLDALDIPHPNWHGLSEMPILAWLGYVDKLPPALRRRNLSEARDAINHVDMARGLKPSPTER